MKKQRDLKLNLIYSKSILKCTILLWFTNILTKTLSTHSTIVQDLYTQDMMTVSTKQHTLPRQQNYIISYKLIQERIYIIYKFCTRSGKCKNKIDFSTYFSFCTHFVSPVKLIQAIYVWQCLQHLGINISMNNVKMYITYFLQN